MVFDLETETYESHKRKAAPFDKRNWIVAPGWKYQGDKQCSWSYHPTYDREVFVPIPKDIMLIAGFNIKFDLLWQWDNPEFRAFLKRGGTIWDCQYVEYLLEAQNEKWQMCSLNDCAEKYGGTTKIDAVKEMWEAGYKTSEIPEDLLIDYLVGTKEEGRNGGDVRNTEIVFLNQVRRVKELGMSRAINLRMDGLLCTTEMEWNGLKIDVEEARRRLKILEEELEVAQKELSQFIPEFPEGAVAMQGAEPFEFKWTSVYHKSALIFGGSVKYRKKMPILDDTGQPTYTKAKAAWPLFNKRPMDPALDKVLSRGHFTMRLNDDGSYSLLQDGKPVMEQDRFLSGKRKDEPKTKQVDVKGELKTRYEEFIFDFPGYIETPTDEWDAPKEGWESTLTDARDNNLWRTNNEALEILGKRDVPFCKVLGKHTALVKEIGTYYVKWDPQKKCFTGMLTCVNPVDHIIHHKLNHTSTITSRLSASDPNCQNIPRGDKSEVKKMFVSRFGANGRMIEADYSQLEVVVQGVLSNDPKLCEDLRNRIDFHCKRVSLKFGCTYEEALHWCKDEDYPEHALWKKRRTGCKQFSFQRAYGAGPQKIADSTGMTVDDVKELIRVEEQEYAGIPKFNESVERIVSESAKPFRDPNRGYRTYRRGYWQGPTGTIYTWRSWDAPAHLRKRGVDDTFSPPELKNYPVQGTGGEFVQAVLGRLFRHFLRNDNYEGKAFLVNTVHDCVWIDAHADVYEQVAKDIKPIMESIPALFNGMFGMNITVPFPVDVEAGLNMYSLHGV
jgi:DNA polymerase I-like protein with 3'-5' exonuclease and polymerase domains